ncbi:hypothetical protein DES53_106181 [Roseimicrobium gellanilyticum]|uniref:Uncharacterized protein n=1 Tax=Roseimicrobium gellanilyticum TaxID=748857 RepID=A0A366HL36_9BACT|nr:hypothetical protein [Roseimicrobium gellanilyticum]RBP42473.1 hypothetical protein DES53_106181 [Roseimicrobium gellanilyticum]
MKLSSLLSLVACLAFTSVASADTTTIHYPDEENAVFTVTAPDDWEFEAGTEDDPYCTLTKEDTVLYFKTVEGTEEALTEAIEETYEYVKETYPKAELPKPEETKIDGKPALAAAGKGKDEDGTPTEFGFAWVFVGKGKIAEIWFESADTDKKIVEEAVKILKSFKAGK